VCARKGNRGGLKGSESIFDGHRSEATKNGSLTSLPESRSVARGKKGHCFRQSKKGRDRSKGGEEIRVNSGRRQENLFIND